MDFYNSVIVANISSGTQVWPIQLCLSRPGFGSADLQWINHGMPILHLPLSFIPNQQHYEERAITAPNSVTGTVTSTHFAPKDRQEPERIENSQRKRSGLEKVRRIPLRKADPNKNTESNISNQAFSFIALEKRSSHTLWKILNFEYKAPTEIYQLYYAYVGVLRKTKGKYISKQTLALLSIHPTCKMF